MRAAVDPSTTKVEHGIGQRERRFVTLEHGAGADVMAAMKRATDPSDIMNPGRS